MELLLKFIAESWYLFRTSFFGICAILLPITLPIDAINTAIEFWPETSESYEAVIWSVLLAEMLIYPIYQGALILFIGSVASGGVLKTKDYYRLSLKVYPRLLVFYILSTLAIGFGFILLIIPGVIIAVRLMFSEFHCIFDGESGSESFGSSLQSTQPYQWILFLGILIFIITLGVPFIGVQQLLSEYDLWSWPISFLVTVISTLLGSLVTIFVFRIYTYHIEMLHKPA